MSIQTTSHRRSDLALAGLVFLQMLPATVLTPAVRPLFARLHPGSEGAMHAFMSLNMIAAALIAPWIGRKLDARDARRRWLSILCFADAVLLWSCTLPLATSLVLSLRFFEGGAHVGAATLLLSEALAIARVRGEASVMGMMGAGIMAAVALGNVLGALLVGWSPEAPFYVASACALLVAAWGQRALRLDLGDRSPSRVRTRDIVLGLALPLSGVFVARFSIGCLVVTFALFAHHHHHLSDRTIGGLFACMTVPFALLTYPATRWLRSFSAERALLLGAALYAACLFAIRYAPAGALAWIMMAAGAASALIFSAQLRYVARHTPQGADGRGMAWFNAAGCAGMLLGPIVAGLTIASRRAALGAVAAYASVFTLASLCVLGWTVGAALWLSLRERSKIVVMRTPSAAERES